VGKDKGPPKSCFPKWGLGLGGHSLREYEEVGLKLNFGKGVIYGNANKPQKMKETGLSFKFHINKREKKGNPHWVSSFTNLYKKQGRGTQRARIIF